MKLLLFLLSLVASSAWGITPAERFCPGRYAQLLKARRALAQKQFETAFPYYRSKDSAGLEEEVRFHSSDLETARKQAAAMVEDGANAEDLARELSKLEERNSATAAKLRRARTQERNNTRQWLEYLGKEKAKLAAMPAETFEERIARWKAINDFLVWETSFQGVTANAKNPRGILYLGKPEHERLLQEQAATWREVQRTLAPAEARALWWKHGYHDAIKNLEHKWEGVRENYEGHGISDYGRYLSGKGMGSMLAQRLAYGDRHPKTLLRMGYTAEKEKGLVPPETYFALAESINAEIDRAIQAGLLTEKEAFRPSLYFHSRKNWDDSKLVKVGIDPWPDPREFTLATEAPQFDNSTWQKYLSEGNFPLMPGGFLEHDASHWSEFLDEPRLMAETRAHFERWLALRKEKSFSEGINHFPLAPHHDSSFSLGFRTMLFTEFFSLPDVARKREILAVFPELATMTKSAASDWRVHLEELKKLGPDELENRFKRWAEKGKPFIARQGGGIRDAYNYEGRFDLGNTLGPAFDGKRLTPNQTHGHWTNDAMMAGSLLHVQTELAQLRKLRNGRQEAHPSLVGYWSERFNRADPVERKKVIDELMLVRLAKLESGFRTGLDTGLTPAQVVHESSVLKMDPNSATSRYVGSISDDYGPLWEAFLSPTARGKN